MDKESIFGIVGGFGAILTFIGLPFTFALYRKSLYQKAT